MARVTYTKNKIAMILIACAFGFVGCSDSEDIVANQPVETLYKDAMDNLDKGSYTAAAKSFVEVERQHPYSNLAPKSLLLAAYSYYQGKKYEDAIENYNVFIQLHPGHENVAYAYYMVGICYYEQIPLVSRDQKTTELSLTAFEEVERRFPSTPYGKDAKLKIDLVRDHLAGKEMEIGRYYLKQQAYLAAVNRFQNVVEGFQTTSHVPEALHRMVECYLAIGILDQAQKMALILGHNYPGSSWYADTYALMATAMPESIGKAPKPNPAGPSGHKAPEGVIGAPAELAKAPMGNVKPGPQT